jgi:hypothetical protein
MIVASVISTGGATVLAVKTLGRRDECGEASGSGVMPGAKEVPDSEIFIEKENQS